MLSDDIAQVRRFNRAVTRRIGALDDSYLSRGRPLGEARVLFEIGAAGGIGLQELRRRLSLDSGYLSRLIRSLESQGLVELHAEAADARARRAVLSDAGRREHAAYDRLSDALAAGLLDRLTVDRRARLVRAMAEVADLLSDASLTVDVEEAGSADARWCLEQYYAELASRFPAGFDPLAGANFDPAGLTPPQGWFVVARLEGGPAGCGALKRTGPDAAEVKRVWTASAARGRGVATAIMDRLEGIAAEAGFARIRLDTNRTLGEARAMYLKRGYREIAPYNDNPYADHWFEKALG